MAAMDCRIQELETLVAERSLHAQQLDVDPAERVQREQALESEVAAQRQRLSRVQEEFAQVHAERDMELAQSRQVKEELEARVASLQSMILALHLSTSWRLTAPLRGFKQLLLRLKHSNIVYFLSQIRRAIVSRSGAPLSDLRAARKIARSEYFNRDWYLKGWYGSLELRQQELYTRERAVDRISWNAKFDAASFAQQTIYIIERYLKSNHYAFDWHLSGLKPEKILMKSIRNSKPSSDCLRNSFSPTYSIITSFYKHIEFFQHCAEQIAALMVRDLRETRKRRVEWIILNDDPAVTRELLLSQIPADIRDFVNVKSDGKNLGISSRQNEGISLAVNDWLMFVDCDDLVASDATLVLDHYIRLFDHCRYISSGMIDIDEMDQILRRRQKTNPVRLFERGMIVSHLVSIRRDLFDEMGKFDLRFSGCQDYDLALRVAKNEPLLSIPDVLYAYRWHANSQSVGSVERQARLTAAVRKEALRQVVERTWPEQKSSRGLNPPVPVEQGICIIRTQGKRTELLERALDSIAAQTEPITPLVVVHGNDDVFKKVKYLIHEGGHDVILLHAPDVSRRRGYPINCALDFIRSSESLYDYVCMLDDDDIYYPLFSDRIISAFNFTNADVVYGLTNKREPGGSLQGAHPAMPTSFLVSGNFMPTNSFAIRTSVIRATDCRFRDDIHYLEDWDFLLSLLEGGARFALIPEVISEFLVIGDGNTTVKNDPKHYAECHFELLAHGRAVARSIGLGRMYRDLLDFNEEGRIGFGPLSNESILDLERIFEQSQYVRQAI